MWCCVELRAFSLSHAAPANSLGPVQGTTAGARGQHAMQCSCSPSAQPAYLQICTSVDCAVHMAPSRAERLCRAVFCPLPKAHRVRTGFLPSIVLFKALYPHSHAASAFSSPSALGKSSTSKMTRIIRLQLGQTAISSPSRRSSIVIWKRSPQGQGYVYVWRAAS